MKKLVLLISSVLLTCSSFASSLTKCEIAGRTDQIEVYSVKAVNPDLPIDYTEVQFEKDLSLNHNGIDFKIKKGPYAAESADITDQDNFRITIAKDSKAEDLFSVECTEGAELYMYSRHGKGGVIFVCNNDSAPAMIAGAQIYCQ